MFEFVFNLKETKFGLSVLIVASDNTLLRYLKMFHLLLFLLVVLIIFIGIAEGLISLELFFNHPLQDSVMRELFLHLKEFLSNFPLVFGLGQLIYPFFVQLGLDLLSK